MSLLSNVTSTVGSIAGLVLVSPQNTVGYQPQINPTGVISNSGFFSLLHAQQTQGPSLLFHYEGENTVTIKSDITDHYVENNSAIQDQIALRPEMVTVHGFIGELNDIPPPLLALAQSLANKLTVIGAYSPGLSTNALIAYNTAFQLYQTASNALSAGVSALASLTGQDGENVIGSSGFIDANTFNASTGAIGNNQSKQQTAFQQFYGYWRNRTLFNVQTPWAIFQNMAIEELRAVQDESTNVITDFYVSFKMIRFALTAQSAAQLQAQGRAASQQSIIRTAIQAPATSSGTSFSGATTKMEAAG